MLILKHYTGGGRRPITQKMIDKTRPTTNKIHAISMAIPATPVTPKTAATIAMIKNVIARLIIIFLPDSYESINMLSYKDN